MRTLWRCIQVRGGLGPTLLVLDRFSQHFVRQTRRHLFMSQVPQRGHYLKKRSIRERTLVKRPFLMGLE